MNPNRVRHTLMRQLADAWTQFSSCIGSIAPGCAIKPESAADVFKVGAGTADTLKVEIGPVALRLKEKASETRSQMFVTVAGEIHFSMRAEDGPFLAFTFKTEVGYFRAGGANLDHVLGVHYDCDDNKVGHPVFHAQFTTCEKRLATINEHFNPPFTLQHDRMSHVARKIRLPTAHMDPLAVFVQLLADHLINVNSGPSEMSAFERARSALMFFKSDPDGSRCLDEAYAHHCMRGPRWYPPPASGTMPVPSP